MKKAIEKGYMVTFYIPEKRLAFGEDGGVNVKIMSDLKQIEYVVAIELFDHKEALDNIIHKMIDKL